jgi:hypothetical protein
MGLGTVDTVRVHPQDHDHDTVEAHYASLERLRPHACNDGDGWVFVGWLDEDGEEQYEAYVCRRCQEQQSEEETS